MHKRLFITITNPFARTSTHLTPPMTKVVIAMSAGDPWIKSISA